MRIITTVVLLLFAASIYSQNNTQTIESSFFYHKDFPEVSCSDYCSVPILKINTDGEMTSLFIDFVYVESLDKWELRYEGDAAEIFFQDEYGEYHVNEVYNNVLLKIGVETIIGEDEMGTYSHLTLKSVNLISSNK